MLVPSCQSTIANVFVHAKTPRSIDNSTTCCINYCVMANKKWNSLLFVCSSLQQEAAPLTAGCTPGSPPSISDCYVVCTDATGVTGYSNCAWPSGYVCSIAAGWYILDVVRHCLDYSCTHACVRWKISTLLFKMAGSLVTLRRSEKIPDFIVAVWILVAMRQT